MLPNALIASIPRSAPLRFSDILATVSGSRLLISAAISLAPVIKPVSVIVAYVAPVSWFCDSRIPFALSAVTVASDTA